MRISIITDDNCVVKDGAGYTLDLSSCGIPSNVHALQWNGSSGEIEYNDGTTQHDIDALPSWATSAVEVHDAKVAEINSPLTDADLEFAAIIERARLMNETDHWALSDTPPMTQEEMDYRQALRDITSAEGWPTDHVWPTKPARNATIT